MGYGNGSANVGFTPSPVTAAPRVSPVNEQMNALDRSIDGLHQLISEIEGRLSPVLGPPPPNSDGQALIGAGGNLAIAISSQNARVSGAAMRLRELLDRIEL